jgi:hypothetical protein
MRDQPMTAITREPFPGDALHGAFIGPEQPRPPPQFERAFEQAHLSMVGTTGAELEDDPERGSCSSAAIGPAADTAGGGSATRCRSVVASRRGSSIVPICPRGST